MRLHPKEPRYQHLRNRPQPGLEGSTARHPARTTPADPLIELTARQRGNLATNDPVTDPQQQTKNALTNATPATNSLQPSGGDQGSTADQPARGSRPQSHRTSRAQQCGQTGNDLPTRQSSEKRFHEN
jgi:hypothetical protein